MKATLCKLSLLSSLVLAMAFTSCGKKDTAESVTDELLSKFSELTAAAGSAKDKESAEKAAKTINELSEDIDGIVKRLEALPEPSDEEKKAIDAKMDKAMDENGEKMGEAMKNLTSDPEAMKIIGEALKNFGEKMQSHEATFKKFGKKD